MLVRTRAARDLGFCRRVHLDEVWSSSTWMAEEAHHAVERKLVPKTYYWNPNGVVVTARGMVPYLQSRLPDDLDELLGALTDLVG